MIFDRASAIVYIILRQCGNPLKGTLLRPRAEPMDGDGAYGLQLGCVR